MSTASKRAFNNVKTSTTQSGRDPKTQFRGAAYDAQQQLRQGQDNRSIDTFRPLGAKAGDTTMRLGPDNTLALAISDGRGNWREAIIPCNLYGNTAIADPTGGATVDTEARAALASILSLLRNLTVIDP